MNNQKKIRGVVMCEYARSLDVASRGYDVADRVSEIF